MAIHTYTLTNANLKRLRQDTCEKCGDYFHVGDTIVTKQNGHTLTPRHQTCYEALFI
jgi:hypothetical protein